MMSWKQWALALVAFLPAADATVYDAIVNANLTTFADYATSVGLDAALSDPNEIFTVFAPIDKAFDELPIAVVEYFENNLDVLLEVLESHVTDSDYDSAILTQFSLGDFSIPFLSGKQQPVQSVNGSLFVGFAEVIESDIQGSNGIVHVIDSVLVPSIEEVLAENSVEFDTLATLLQVSGIAVPELYDVTVFAPTSDAFDSFATEFPDLFAVLAAPNWRLHLEALLYAHVAEGALFSSRIENFPFISMFLGDEFDVNTTNGLGLEPSTGGDGVALVVVPNVYSNQGAVHGMDQVLLPPFTALSIGGATSVSLALLVETADLTDFLLNTFGLTCK